MPPAQPRLDLVCFGPPTARVDGREAPPEVLWRKHLALLVYLALSPDRRRTRDHLLGLFWAESPDAKARRALNEALFRLRGALGDHRLRSESDTVVLHDAGLDVDVLRFTATAERVPDDALRLLRGEFLEGFHVNDAPAFDDWARLERERLGALAVSTLVASGEQALPRSRLADAADAARRARALAPYSEPAVRLLMRASALAGDAATALAAYHDFAGLIERELGEKPSRDLAGLADRIRQHAWRPLPAPGAEREPPLVGRERAHGDAFALIPQGVAGGARVLVITGAPGMGRTRLLRECLERVALEGAVSVVARPLETDHDSRWSALRLLLRAGLVDAPGAVAARPEALGALAWLLPELGPRFSPRPVEDVAGMAASLAAVLAAVAQERPLALALDDAQWADGASVAALAAAVGQVGSAPVMLIVTVAHGVGDPPQELLRLQSDVGRGVLGTVVRVDPLTKDDIAALVAALAPWCQDDAARDRLARRLAWEAGGNPFFAVTLLRALARATTLREDVAAWPPLKGTDAPRPFSVPLVHRAVVVRLSELGEDEKVVLIAASVGADAIDLDLVAALSDRSRAAVERALAALERRHFVTFDGSRYAFAAPIITDVVRAECLTRGERRNLAERALVALEGRDDLDVQVLRVELMARARPGPDARAAALAVARAAEEAGAQRSVRRALAAAERASQPAR